uniref:hypothetical protein n=1 Tax=Borreliella valaisiana TaxID=62088 RepID=UPI001B34ACC6
YDIISLNFNYLKRGEIMSKYLLNKQDNKFIKKSNVIVRAVTNDCAGIMTQRLFNFAILNSLHKLN